MFDVNEIARRIKLRREDLGLTLDEVAQVVGVDKSTVMRYENGNIVRPKIPVLHSIANALDVRPEWLLGKSDQMEDEDSWNWDGSYLKELRERKSLSIEEAALRLGISSSRYRSIESSSNRPTVPLLISMAEVFYTSVDLLLHLEYALPDDSTSSGFTKKDTRMILAYHRASSEIQRVVDLTLSPYEHEKEKENPPLSSTESVG